jgi:IS5 family transposase
MTKRDEAFEAMRKALQAASGYLLNAKIDLETGAPRKTATQTIDGGLKVVRAALRLAEEGATAIKDGKQ